MDRFYYEAAEDDNIWWIYDRLEGDAPIGNVSSFSMARLAVGLLNDQSRKAAEEAGLR